MMRILAVLFVLILGGCANKDDVDKLRFLEKGNQAFANKDYLRAANYYEEALLKDSTFVDAWNNRGLALMKLGHYDDAIQCFDAAIHYKPEYGEALLNNAHANLSVHQYFAAAEIVDRLNQVWPDSSLVYFVDGLVKAGQGNEEGALQAFKDCLAKDNTNTEAMVNIGNIYYHANQADSAMVYLQKAITVNPEESNAYNILAMVYANNKAYEKALASINKALVLNAKDPYYVNNKGYILLKLGRQEEAEQFIIEGMKMDPYNGWTYRNLGLLRHEQGRLDDAIRLLEKAFKMDKHIDNIAYDLALTYRDAGRSQDACKLLLEIADDTAIVALKQELCN